MNSNIFFQPFVDKDYANGGIFGKRIMILGESHYCDESCTDCGDCQLHRECMNFTQQVLDEVLYVLLQGIVLVDVFSDNSILAQ